MQFNMLKRQVSGAALALACNLGKVVPAAIATAALAASGYAWADEATYSFDIPAAPAEQTLKIFTDQSGVRVFADYDAAVRTQTNAVKGRYSAEQALRQMLQGTKLEIADVANDRISVRVKTDTGAEKANGTSSLPVGITQPEKSVEVIVTGTHIRGGNPTSPVRVVSRNDIDVSGYSQIGDLMRSLPENFSGGQNPGVLAADPGATGANSNYSNASTMNLRGLGSDATLTLLNGHRLSGEALYEGSDVSGVPLAAVSRVEVVTDGASAIYGSDAVAGVVNIITRKDFDGGELSANVGGTSRGGGNNQTYSLLEGKSSANWHVLGNIEYSQQNPIYASDRSFTSGMVPDATLLRGMQRRSLFLDAGWTPFDGFDLSLNGIVGDRRTEEVQQTKPTTTRYENTAWTPNYSMTAGADFKLPADWKGHLAVTEAGSRNVLWSHSPTTGSVSEYKNTARSAEVNADGTLLMLPSGALKAAVGIGQRDEGFAKGLPGQSGYLNLSRGISYAYVEAIAPLVQPSNDRVGLHALELSLSARTENYSDLGVSSNPRIGLRYVPIDGLTFRGSWGTSFKAPTFYQQYGPLYALQFSAATFGGTSVGTALLAEGSNPNLKPERSRSWTFGGDFKPNAIPSLVLTGTYFHIAYDDRVVTAVPVYTQGLSNPIYSPFVVKSPTAAQQAALIAGATAYYNLTGKAYDPTNVVAIIEDQYVNATAQTIQGFDLAYRQTFVLRAARVDTFANATWTELKQQTLPTEPQATLSGTIFNVPKFKARAGATFSEGNLSATGFVNYISSEKDTGVTPVARIASWTTLDGNVSYRFRQNGIKLALAASNLLDAMPPYAKSPSLALPGFTFDSTNANILGRAVSLTVSKTW